MTPTEKMYFNLVINSIQKKNISNDEKCKLLMDFLYNGKMYYDYLCDYLYYLSTNKSDLSLWISPNGKPHLAISCKDSKDIKVIDPATAPNFNGDLTDFLNIVLYNYENSYLN